MKRLLFLLWLACVSCSSVEQGLFNGQWVDLSHDFSAETIYWPTSRGFEKTTVFEGYTAGGFYYTAYDFCAAEHGGTHIDAPIHFAKDHRTVDEIPVDQLIGPGVIIRVAEKVKMDRNYQFTIDDILEWEKKYGKIPDNSILLIDTGSSRFWPNKREYMGTDERGEEGVKKLKFPGIHPDTAKFLVSERKIKAVGLDTPSLDYGGSTRFESHQTFFEHNIPGFENVTNLEKLPVKGALIFALPMKIKGGSGGPLRIVAWVPAK
jgi:kynurenine formamidase